MNKLDSDSHEPSFNATSGSDTPTGRTSALAAGPSSSTLSRADPASELISQHEPLGGGPSLRTKFKPLRMDRTTDLPDMGTKIESVGEEFIGTSPFNIRGTTDFFKQLIEAWSSKFPTVSERVALWQQSRGALDPTEVTPVAQSRPITPKNLALAMQLAPAVFTELLPLYWKAAGFQLLIYLLGNVIAGILPAWHALALARLLDCVQDAMSTGKAVDRRRILWLAGVNLMAAHSERILNLLLEHNNRFVRDAVDQQFEYLHLKSQLSLDFPTLSNPEVAPLLVEAAAFAGFEAVTASTGAMYSGPPSTRLTTLTSGLTDSISILSQSTVMITTILGTSKGPVSFSSIAFIIMSFLPALLGLFTVPNQRWSPLFASTLTKSEVLEMGRNGQYKQEILSFGLTDWVIGKWNQANEAVLNERKDVEESRSSVAISLVRDSIETIGYALIALGVFPPAVSIGNMRLCQSSASSLVRTIKSYHCHVEDFLTFVFLATAFMESLRMDQTLLKREQDLVVYRPVTHADGRKGMRIEAKNLSFCYPGSTVPSLKNVNLTVEPGETLAIVGFNGGGKTTLVKVLMGLFDYEGTLLINGKDANSYVRSSLHARTTVCFQDFARYNLTIRENVGTGNYPRMDDAELLGESLRRGGADSIVEKFPAGVDQHLEKSWMSPTGAEPILPSKPVPPPPPPTGEKGPPPPGKAKGGPPSLGGPGPPPAALGLNGGPPPKGRFQRRKARAWMRDSKGLSGGQWQRIALARAFMRSDEADLVVFDEPSASLDARAEHELFERIHQLSIDETGKKIRTTIYVSHRFSTTRRADKIAVVEEGTISELGSHEQLMALGGRYAEFFNLQAKAFVD